MSEIKKGDLVYVAKWGCCGGAYGWTFRVAKIERRQAGRTILCRHCGNTYVPPTSYLRAVSEDGRGISTSMLKKIDPPAQSTDTPTKEDLHEPA